MLGDSNSTYIRRHIKIINYLRYLIIVKIWKGTEKTNMNNWNIHEAVEYYKGQDGAGCAAESVCAGGAFKRGAGT